MHRFAERQGRNLRQEGLTAEYGKYAEQRTSSRFAFRVFGVFRGQFPS